MAPPSHRDDARLAGGVRQKKFLVYRKVTVWPSYQPLVVPMWVQLLPADIAMPAIPADDDGAADDANAVPDMTASPAAMVPARASPTRRMLSRLPRVDPAILYLPRMQKRNVVVELQYVIDGV